MNSPRLFVARLFGSRVSLRFEHGVPPVQKLKTPPVIIEDRESVNGGIIRVLKLNRPLNRNALSQKLVGRLTHRIVEVDNARRKRFLTKAGEEGRQDNHQEAKGVSLKERVTKTTVAVATEDAQSGTEGTGPEAIHEDNREDSEDSDADRDHAIQPNLANVRAIIIASEVDGVFCAGADLKEREQMSIQQARRFLSVLRALFNKLASMDIPTISAVSGYALGGGLELALATTFRVFHESATVGLPETSLGIIPGAGGTYRMRKLIGETNALDLILTGRRIQGREAKDLGLCQRFQCNSSIDENDRESTIDAAYKFARDLTSGAPLALRAALEATRCSSDKEDLEKENGPYESIIHSEDRLEALRAFKEKRPPIFQGK